MKKRYLLIVFSFLFMNCYHQRSRSHEETEIVCKLSDFYRLYGSSNEGLYVKPLEKDLFSIELGALLQNTIRISKEDIERVKNSSFHDDKPLLLEGSIFSSLYEGWTYYRIGLIEFRYSRTGTLCGAVVNVDFQYLGGTSQEYWSDKVFFVYEDNIWRIDDIGFAVLSRDKTLRERLLNFVK